MNEHEDAVALAIYDNLLSEKPTACYNIAEAGKHQRQLRLLEKAREHGLEAAIGTRDAILARPGSPLAQLLTRREELEKCAHVGTLLSDVVPESVQWLWRGRLALKKLHMLDGYPGLGKTMVALDLIA